MSSTLDLSEYIVRFDKESTKSGELPVRNVIDDRTEANITIDQRPLQNFFDRVFRIPDYQRDYQWTNKEWEELWGRIQSYLDYNQADPSTQTTDVFFGSMFLSERDASVVSRYEIDGDVYDIIDGQQRITTVSILLKVLSDVLVDELSGCSAEFISQYSQHVGLLNNHIFIGGETESGPSLIRQDSGVGMDRNSDDTFYEAIMKGEDAQIDHLLTREQKHNNTRKGVIRMDKYMSVFGIDMDDYLEELLDDDNFEGVNRPNLTSSKMSVIRNADSVDDIDDDFRDYIRKNKISFSVSEEHLLEAYEFFKERVEETMTACEDVDDSVEDKETVVSERKYRLATNIKNYVLNSFRVGYFKVNDRQPQLLMRIFEVLNEHGVELKITDLIRTRLVMHFREESDSEYTKYKSKWESVVSEFNQDPERVVSFLETYFVATEDGVTSRGQVSNHLLEAFTEASGEEEILDSRVETVSDAKELVDDLEKYAEYYHHIEDPLNYGFELESDSVERRSNKVLLRMKDAGTDIWEPLVLAAYSDVKEGKGDEEWLIPLLNTIESLVIRFSVAGSVNSKDSTYEKAIEAYDAHGIGGEVEKQLVETAFKSEESLFGDNIVVELMRNDWSNKKARAVLRKIASQNLNDQSDEQMVYSRLGTSNEQIQVEHIFPKSPLDGGDDRYGWVRSFFSIPDDNIPDDDDLEGVKNIVKTLIEEDDVEEVTNICNEFSDLIGNRVLLLGETNAAIANSRYGRKLAGYSVTDGFEKLATSQHIVENDLQGEDAELLQEYGRLMRYKQGNPNWDEIDVGPDDVDDAEEKEEWTNERLEELEPIVAEFDGEWTINRVASNSEVILELLTDLIGFEDCTSGSVSFDDSVYDSEEFEDINIREIVNDEIQGRNELLKYTYSRHL